MIKISKIKNVQSTGTWESKHDGATMYKYEYEFEDGTKKVGPESDLAYEQHIHGKVMDFNKIEEIDELPESGNEYFVGDDGFHKLASQPEFKTKVGQLIEDFNNPIKDPINPDD